MPGSTFQTNPYDLDKLLQDCHRGTLQLPDFQRSWVWDEDRIKSLIASVSQAFPVGALMTLDTGGEVNFKPRPVEGAPPEAKLTHPHALLLDGQQRMTSLYQVTLRGKVVETVTPKNKKVRRWFYLYDGLGGFAGGGVRGIVWAGLCGAWLSILNIPDNGVRAEILFMRPGNAMMRGAHPTKIGLIQKLFKGTPP